MKSNRAIFLCENKETVFRVYSATAREILQREAALAPEVVASGDIPSLDLSEIETVFSTWGMPLLRAEELAAMPKLATVFYAAGSVRHFAAPLMARGIAVIHAAAANAIPVAEYVASQILLANKGFFRHCAEMKAGCERPFVGAGNFGAIVALLGFGCIARLVAEKLRAGDLRLLVYDPLLADAEAAAYGVEKVSLEKAFAVADVVSCHLPDLPATKSLLGEREFSSMRHNAVFINTGRGATVRENELAETLARRPDLWALLDVTFPEPAAKDSPLRKLPNVVLTGHIAGSVGNETFRMGDLMVEEFLRRKRGLPFRFQVDPAALAVMA
ncbi:MAG: hydroxyacid dehydrogenase [Victivallaceae bacterium]|nr:hydroxyacid dehydrogenase [Victivallaceae bacterium]